MGLDETLAGVERFETCDFIQLGFQLVCKPVEKQAPLGSRGGRPSTIVEGGACSVDGLNRIRFTALGDGADRLAGRGACDRPRRAV